MNLNLNAYADIVDSSGMSFFYTSTPRLFDAGTLLMGYGVDPTMIIPPGANQFTVVGQCSSNCTQVQVHGTYIL